MFSTSLNNGGTEKTGTIKAFGGSIPPFGWLVCDGSAISRTLYAALFDVIGETYGAGDGSTTFNLPNTTDRVLQGNGNGYKSAGLPDITAGGIVTYNYQTPNGAFYQSANQSGLAQSGGGSGKIIAFKASNSNNIYGASNTVQPPACKFNFIIKY